MFHLKLLARFAFAVTIVGGVLFGSAGRLDLPFFWAYLGVLAGFVVLMLSTIPRELLEERLAPRESGRDNLALLRAAGAMVLSSELVTAGLDVGRFHWSDTVPTALRAAGLACQMVVFAVWYWAMSVNPFFSAAARVQRERGHHVVSSGPYRFVRHPGYATFVLLGWGGPLSLGSWWAALPHLAVVALFLRRAAIEDRMLLEELPGYAAYAAEVRYRFLPGLW